MHHKRRRRPRCRSPIPKRSRRCPIPRRPRCSDRHRQLRRPRNRSMQSSHTHSGRRSGSPAPSMQCSFGLSSVRLSSPEGSRHVRSWHRRPTLSATTIATFEPGSFAVGRGREDEPRDVGCNRCGDRNRQDDVPSADPHALAEAWISQPQSDADVGEEQEERSGPRGERRHPAPDCRGRAERRDYRERVEQRYRSGEEAQDDVAVDRA